MVERFAGLQLPQDLTFYQGVRYTLLLRHRDTLDGVDWSRPIKLRVPGEQGEVQIGRVWDSAGLVYFPPVQLSL